MRIAPGHRHRFLLVSLIRRSRTGQKPASTGTPWWRQGRRDDDIGLEDGPHRPTLGRVDVWASRARSIASSSERRDELAGDPGRRSGVAGGGIDPGVGPVLCRRDRPGRASRRGVRHLCRTIGARPRRTPCGAARGRDRLGDFQVGVESKGACRLERDGAAVPGATITMGETIKTTENSNAGIGQHWNWAGVTAVSGPHTGAGSYSVAAGSCRATSISARSASRPSSRPADRGLEPTAAVPWPHDAAQTTTSSWGKLVTFSLPPSVIT